MESVQEAAASASAVAATAAELLANASSALALQQPPALTAAEAQYARMQAEAIAAHAGHDHPRSRREAGFVLWSTLAALVLAQAALVRFKRAYPRAYAAVTLFGLWLAPCAFASSASAPDAFASSSAWFPTAFAAWSAACA